MCTKVSKENAKQKCSMFTFRANQAYMCWTTYLIDIINYILNDNLRLRLRSCIPGNIFS